MEEQPGLRESCILIVDDLEQNVRLLRYLLRMEGYRNLTSTNDPREVPKICESIEPDLLIVDLHMPHMNGIELVQRFRRTPFGAFVPVLVLTADSTPEAKRNALAAGAKDFLCKPLDANEVYLRVHNLLETRDLYKRLRVQNSELEGRVRERTGELARAQVEALDCLALASDYRDDATGDHTHRVGVISALIAKDLGWPEENVETLRLAAPLHDIGKIGVSDQVLLKEDKLAPEERLSMRRHTVIGAQILSRSTFPVLQIAREIALYHHERWDGSGYPEGLSGEAIPPAARIVAVVDVFDALTHRRPYKAGWSFSDAVAEIREQSGKHFDPKVVEAFLRAVTPAAFEAIDSPRERQSAGS